MGTKWGTVLSVKFDVYDDLLDSKILGDRKSRYFIAKYSKVVKSLPKLYRHHAM